MGFNFDFTSDFYLQDNLQPLTLQVAGLADVQIPAAASMPAKYAETRPSGGNVLEGDKLFAWPQNASPQPPLGAQDCGRQRRRLDDLGGGRQGRREDLGLPLAGNLAIVNRLDNTAAVLQATYTKSPGGEAMPTWTQVLSGIPARFQPVEQKAQILEDAEWPKTTYHVFLGMDIFAPEIPVEPASADYRLVDSAGRHYRIMSTGAPNESMSCRCRMRLDHRGRGGHGNRQNNIEQRGIAWAKRRQSKSPSTRLALGT